MEEFYYCLFIAWYIFCGFSFARAVKEGSTLYDSDAPFGLSVLLWGVLMPISGLFKDNKQ
jgi:hypothetical protein